MYYKLLKYLVVQKRVCKQLNKVFGISMTATDVRYLFFACGLKNKGKMITSSSVRRMCRLAGLSDDVITIGSRLRYFVSVGFLSYSGERHQSFANNVYQINPVLVEYLREFENRLRKVRWDY